MQDHKTRCDDIIAALILASATNTNDDNSAVGTELRQRSIARGEAMSAAVELITKLSGELTSVWDRRDHWIARAFQFENKADALRAELDALAAMPSAARIKTLEADNSKLEAERDGLKAELKLAHQFLMEDARKTEAAKDAADLEPPPLTRTDAKPEWAISPPRYSLDGIARIASVNISKDHAYTVDNPADVVRIWDSALRKHLAFAVTADDAQKIVDALHAQMISDMKSPYAPKAEAKASDGPIHAPEIASSPAYYVGTKDALTGVPIYCLTGVGPLVVCRTSGLARSVADALNGLINQDHEYRFDKNPWAAKVADLEMTQRALLEAMTGVRDRSIGLFNSVEDAIVKAGGPKS